MEAGSRRSALRAELMTFVFVSRSPRRSDVGELNLAAHMGGHLFERFDEVVADTRAGTTAARFGADTRRSLARSFRLLFFECRHGSATKRTK
jgi:hypothetical protein